MTLSSLPKTTSNTTILIVSRKSPLHLRTSISRHSHAQLGQARALWWWGRSGNEWSTSFDENLEERMRRHQKIMRYRYSKALRRSSLWEKDDGIRAAWPFTRGRWWRSRCVDHQHLSGGRVARAKLEENDNEKSRIGRTFETFHKDFESFKAAVDKAIERDPYGTLFGRRLQGPASTNNSSWTSFSWFFDPKEIKDPKKIQEDGSSQNAPFSPHSSQPEPFQASPPPEKPQSTKSGEEIRPAEMYEYDPISGRKVLKRAPAQTTPEPAPKRPFFETLFGEHGADIPVKPYKPPKVYGYGSVDATQNPVVDAEPNKPKQVIKGFESSRKRELQMLMASTIGNNIDTTAEFGGKYEPDVPKEESTPVSKKARTSVAPDENAPLFSGTTYQCKSQDILSSNPTNSSWLEKEGFASAEPQSSSLKKDDKPVNIPVKTFTGRIQPALERMQSAKPTTDESVRLQPSLDRASTSAIKASVPTNERLLQLEKTLPRVEQKQDEDLDLLRACDVRAATRSARKTKEETDQSKKEARQRLEKDFAERQKDDGKLEELSNAGRTSNSLSALWDHVRTHPQGIVARTMQTMNQFNENFNKYIGGDAVVGVNDHADQSRLEKDPVSHKAISPVSSGKFQNLKSSPEVLEAERKSELRTAALRQANRDHSLLNSTQDRQANDLASALKQEYESEYGIIDANHKQPAISKSSVGESKLHPLKTATVKPGVVTNPIIDHHVNTFEPKYAKMIDETKDIRRELHEVHQHVKAIRSKRPETYCNTSASQLTSDTKDSLVGAITEAEPVTAESSKTALTDQKETLNDQVAGNEIKKQSEFTSTYVILCYNSSIKKVEASPMNTPLVDISKEPNIWHLLSNLNRPSEFFSHFPTLQNAGYELAAGNGDMLIFKKSKPAPSTFGFNKEGRNKIAAAEAASQPEADAPSPKALAGKKAATVLDEIPTDVNPSPGPAAPTAPPSRPAYRPIPSRTPVRRQEQVFSGTIRSAPATNPAAAPPTETTPPASSSTTEQPETSTKQTFNEKPQEPRPGFFTRVGRGIRRVVLTVVAFGAGAYTIGVIAEGIGAQAQLRNGIEDANAQGPRKRVVMTGQRPGIFSTESSR